MALLAHALLTMDEATQALRLESALTYDQQARLEAIINGVTTGVEQVLRRPIVARNRTEWRDGASTEHITTLHRPIVSVSALESWDTTYNTMVLAFQASQYMVDQARGRVTLRNEVFPRGYHNVKVTYSAGWATAPEDVKLEAATMVARIWRDWDTRREEIESVTLAGQSTVLLSTSLTRRVRERLAHYRLPVGVI